MSNTSKCAIRRVKWLKLFLSFIIIVIVYLSLSFAFHQEGSEFISEGLHKEMSKVKHRATCTELHTKYKISNEKSYRSVSYHKKYVHQHDRISNQIQELYNYIQAQVGDLKSFTDKVSAAKIENILEMTSQFKRSLLTDMDELISIEGSDVWAQEKNVHLADVIQARLLQIQNPEDCAKARKVSCTINHPCGFGCQLHHVTFCLLIAYATNRTLIVDSAQWNYNRGEDTKYWEDFFEPISNTCKTIDTHATIGHWPYYDPNVDVIVLVAQTYNHGPLFRPRAVPSDIAATLVHGEPIIWWVGQFVRYLFRPNQRLRQSLYKHGKQIDYKHPVVGIHIRRTDKTSEAPLHAVDEYMKHVIEYYNQLSLRKDVPHVSRRVYVATDDRSVIDEIRQKYPQYNIIADSNISATASVDTRYSTGGLLGIITDLYFLSKSDYLVCTFSSQICRLAYELKNAVAPGDYSRAYKSLDDIWFFAGGSAHVQVALLSHRPQSSEEITLMIGDRILPAGNHWDGYCLGTNTRTTETGLYPAFKVRSEVEIYDQFPAYSGIRT